MSFETYVALLIYQMKFLLSPPNQLSVPTIKHFLSVVVVANSASDSGPLSTIWFWYRNVSLLVTIILWRREYWLATHPWFHSLVIWLTSLYQKVLRWKKNTSHTLLQIASQDLGSKMRYWYPMTGSLFCTGKWSFPNSVENYKSDIEALNTNVQQSSKFKKKIIPEFSV